MPIDASIISQAQNIPQIRYQPESQFESFAKIQPTLNAMQQMRTQAMESQEKMAQRQALQKMRQDLMAAGKSGDLGMYAQALIGSGDTRLMELGAKISQSLMEEQAAEQSLAPFRGQPVTRESVQNMLRAGGAAARAGEQLRQTLPTTPAEVETARAFGFQQTPEGYSAMKGAGRAEAQGPEIVQLMRARDALPAGSPDRALVQARIDKLNAPSSGVTIQMPVPVYDPKTGQTTYVTREEAIGKTPASAAPTALTEAQLIKRRDTIAKEYKSARSALQVTQDVLDSAQAVKSSPGLARATGVGSLLPSFPGGEAAFADVRLQNLKGKITALGKAAAASTGAIGQIANQEWKILADQIAAIEPLKGGSPMIEQIDLLEAQARGAMERIRDAYEKQFGEDFERFPQYADLPAPTSGPGIRSPQQQTAPRGQAARPAERPAQPAPAAGGLTPAEQSELEELRRRFGRQ